MPKDIEEYVKQLISVSEECLAGMVAENPTSNPNQTSQRAIQELSQELQELLVAAVDRAYWRGYETASEIHLGCE